jgi:hypothetical protein
MPSTVEVPMATALDSQKQPRSPAVFPEFSVVSLRRTIKCGDRVVPAGTNGTVIAAYRDGTGYEVLQTAPACNAHFGSM